MVEEVSWCQSRRRCISEGAKPYESRLQTCKGQRGDKRQWWKSSEVDLAIQERGLLERTKKIKISRDWKIHPQCCSHCSSGLEGRRHSNGRHKWYAISMSVLKKLQSPWWAPHEPRSTVKGNLFYYNETSVNLLPWPLFLSMDFLGGVYDYGEKKKPISSRTFSRTHELSEFWPSKSTRSPDHDKKYCDVHSQK